MFSIQCLWEIYRTKIKYKLVTHMVLFQEIAKPPIHSILIKLIGQVSEWPKVHWISKYKSKMFKLRIKLFIKEDKENGWKCFRSYRLGKKLISICWRKDLGRVFQIACVDQHGPLFHVQNQLSHNNIKMIFKAGSFHSLKTLFLRRIVTAFLKTSQGHCQTTHFLLKVRVQVKKHYLEY